MLKSNQILTHGSFTPAKFNLKMYTFYSWSLFVRIQALLSAHDTISVHQKAVEKLSQLVYEPDYYIIDKDMPADVVSPIRVVGLRKNPGEPLVN